MTLNEAIIITNDPFFYPPYKDREQKMEAIHTMTEHCQAYVNGETVTKEELIRKLHIMEQYNDAIPNWVYAVIRGA